MASASSSVSVGPHDYVISNNVINKENVLTNETPEREDNLCCFVCDVKVQGRHYTLATCKTQTSRSRVIEKLGELVGERYMVVISEDDVICRTCANVINSLDRLETEVRAKKDIILGFLEKKYSLTEGELLQNCTNLKMCQLPRVTRKRNNTSLSDEISESKSKKQNTWIHCTQCKYTTEHNSFMVYHTKHHIKQNLSCGEYDVQSLENFENASRECQMQNAASNMDTKTNNKGFVPKKSVLETTETITVEGIPKLSIQPSSTLGSSTGDKKNMVAVIKTPYPRNCNAQNPLSSDDFPVMDKAGYMKAVPQINTTEGLPQSTYIPETNQIYEAQIKIRRSGKQLLTLTEDGKLEMVEIAPWNAELDSHKTCLDGNLPF